MEISWKNAIIIIFRSGLQAPKGSSMGGGNSGQAITINKFPWVKTASGFDHDSLGRQEIWTPVPAVSDSLSVCLQVSPLPSLGISIPICPIRAELIVGQGFLPAPPHGGFMPSGAWQRQQPQCHRPSPWPSFVLAGAQINCYPP